MFEKILANFALHINMDDDDIARVTAALQETRVKKNRPLLHAGEICRNIYFVCEGCLRMYYTDNAGYDHTILFTPENWWAVDIASFSNRKPAFYSLMALEDTRLLYLSYSSLEDLYKTAPRFERFFRILTQNGFNIYQERITAALSLTAEERYTMFRKLYPDLETRIAQKHIASYIGITPVFLSKLRRRL